jgi:hypothetical protein
MLKNKPKKNYRYGPSEGYESRCQRRLQEDLGIDEAAAEAILHLRNQVIELQTQLRQMEAELTIQNEIKKLRLAHYRQVDYEASWVEIELQE